MRFNPHSLKAKLTAVCLGLTMTTALLAVGPESKSVKLSQVSIAKAAETASTLPAAQNKWAIFWYMCGSDLESEGQAATDDLKEMLAGTLPPGVSIIIQGGGTKKWHNEYFSNEKTSRYLYDANGFTQLETMAYRDMGSQHTLEDFLRYSANYPAEHKMLLFWDHGGGTTGGACYDEVTENHLSLNDIKKSLQKVYPSDSVSPPLDIVGFDCCLMATYATANMLHGTSRYLVASEETEPGCGWYYTDIVNAFQSNPDIQPQELSKVICDSYIKGCIIDECDSETTLSAIDLSYLPELTASYEKWGSTVLDSSISSGILSDYTRACATVEKYGGSSSDDTFNQIDLGHLAKKTKQSLPEISQNFLNTLDQAVIYKVNGKYRSNAHGLSGFYPISGSKDDIKDYGRVDSASPVYKELFNLIFKAPDSMLDLTRLAKWPVFENENGYAAVELDSQLADYLSEVRFVVGRFDQDSDDIIWYGEDDDLDIDWEDNIYEDNFQGDWPTLDGYPLHIELKEAGEDYNIYTAPITHNGKDAYLDFARDFNNDSFNIIGISYASEENGMASRQTAQLQPGDKIGIYMKKSSLDAYDYSEKVLKDSLTFSSNSEVQMAALPDGHYAYAFEFVTMQQDKFLSQPVIFTVDNGEITLNSPDEEQDEDEEDEENDEDDTELVEEAENAR